MAGCDEGGENLEGVSLCEEISYLEIRTRSVIGFKEGGGGTDEVYAFSHSSSITLMATDRLHAVSRGKGAECCG